MYHVPLSLVNLSAVDSFHISRTPQLPLCPTLLSSLMSSQILTRLSFRFSEPLVYIFLVVCNITLELRLLCLPCSTHPLLDLFPPYSFPTLPETPEIPESGIPTLPRTRKSGIPEGFHREQGNTLSPPR